MRITSLTVAICANLLLPHSRASAEDVVWTDVVGVSVRGSSLSKYGAPGFDAGAASTKAIANGEGYVEFTASETDTARRVGLSRGNDGPQETDIDFALSLEADGTFGVHEGGVSQGSFGVYAPGDRFKVAVSAGVVQYLRNDTVFFSSSVAPAYPLSVDVSLYSTGATIGQAVISGTLTSVARVAWRDVVSASATANNLVKTRSVAAWNAGAVSMQAIRSGDGFVEFTASETTTARLLGLSHGNTDATDWDVDFAFSLGSAGDLSIIEGGIAAGMDDIYATGDRLRIAVEGGAVNYYKNDVLLYTSTATPTYPLLVDTSLFSFGATLQGVWIVGDLDDMRTEDVFWKNVVGASVSGSNLQKNTSVNGWNAGASSVRLLASGDGFVEFSTGESNKAKILGLSYGDDSQGATDVDFGILLGADASVSVSEKGTTRGTFSKFTSADRFRVAVESGLVRYYKNGILMYRSQAVPRYPLLVDCSLFHTLATIKNAVMGGVFAANQLPVARPAGPYLVGVGLPLAVDGRASSDADGTVVGYGWDFGDGITEAGATPTHTYTVPGSYSLTLTVTDNDGLSSEPATTTVQVLETRDVVWMHVVGATATGTTLTKTTGTYSSGDSGAVSSKAIVSGDGYFEFGTGETSKQKIVGLGVGDVDQSTRDVEFGLFLGASANLIVYESGTPRGTWGTYTAADRFRIQVQAGVVKYFKNDQLFYTSTLSPSYPILLDASLTYNGATVTGAVLVGAIAPNQAPTARIGGPYFEGPGYPITFDGTQSTDTDGILVTYAWDFGDGAVVSLRQRCVTRRAPSL